MTFAVGGHSLWVELRAVTAMETSKESSFKGVAYRERREQNANTACMVERPGRSEAYFFSIPVKNFVTHINPEFRDSMGLVEGQSSDLVRLFTNTDESGVLLGAEKGHNRVGNINNTFVTDAKGLRWEDLDIKAPGLVEVTHGSSGEELKIFPWQRFKETAVSEAKIWGGNDYRSARRSFEYQQILADLGVRTYKSLFVTKLAEWFYKGKKVPIGDIPVVSKDAPVTMDSDALPAGYELAAEVRACRTKTRMEAIIQLRAPTANNKVKIRREVDRARALLYEEFEGSDVGPRTDSIEDYLDWFVESHGRNLGLMHGAGLTHGYMHPGNITLDCRILDLDSMGTFEEAHAGDNERSQRDYGISVSAEYSKAQHVMRDSKTQNLAAFVLVVCTAYEIPMRSGISKKFMDAYSKAQEKYPSEARTVVLAQKAQHK